MSEGTTETRQFGDIATKLLMENDRVRIWEMRLDPGQTLGSPQARQRLHHDPDLRRPDGRRLRSRLRRPLGRQGDRVEGDIAPGNVIYAEAGGIETAINTGKEPFYEIVVELK